MTDTELIDALGGPTRLARELGYGQRGPQRVANWKARGIPAEVKLQRPDLFLQDLMSGLKQANAELSGPQRPARKDEDAQE